MLEVKANILIVDDHPDNLRSLAAILSRAGYKVRKAISGKMALETIRSHPPDLILLDIKMPQMDGYTVCSTLKANAATQRIPIIFLSALDDIADKVKAFTVGGADYIIKPFQAQEVLIRVNNNLVIAHQRQELLAQKKKLQEQNAQLQLLVTLTHRISQTDDFHSALTITLTKICQTIGWDFAEAWIPNAKGTILECSRGWYSRAPTFDLFRYHRITTTFAPNIGLPGRVWLSKKPEWSTEISAESAGCYLCVEKALNLDMNTSVGVPILFRDRVLAILVFFKQARSEPEPGLIELIQLIAAQLGTLMQRIKVETALFEANQKLKQLVTIDGLTGIANRRKFDQYIHREWKRLFREQLPLSLILGDIDFFKLYNDTYGHQAGDDCLRKVATKIRLIVKRPADLVARYGGEELAVILPNTDAQGAIHVAETIRQSVENLKIIHASSDISHYVTLSLGVSSLIPNPLVNIETLINQTDKALYRAKAGGRNQTVAEYSIPANLSCQI
ncbi:diguanylate cyclase [Coleofasciculus sp.]|uniref:diguanylate cyclase n=1 Tax=Coleofasciculus sp. TaxID=3100458 RepID=UPI0039F74FB1